MYVKSIFFTLLILCSGCVLEQSGSELSSNNEPVKVTISSGEWQLVGDLRLPDASGQLPAVLILNKAAGDRTVYKELAIALTKRGIAALALDLRGHGESINMGRFVPGEEGAMDMIWTAEKDVIAAQQYLVAHKKIDSNKIAIIGASYSGEEMAEAGRQQGYVRAYVALSPGSFSDASIQAIDDSASSWFFIVSKEDRYLKQITEDLLAHSDAVELLLLPGSKHASDILAEHPEIAERIAVWLSGQLK